jgi:hypothetical protein
MRAFFYDKKKNSVVAQRGRHGGRIALTLSHAQARKPTGESPLRSIGVVAVWSPANRREPQLPANCRPPRFVQSHTTPSTFIDQITRWRICPLTRGLDAAMSGFVTARIRAVARAGWSVAG